MHEGIDNLKKFIFFSNNFESAIDNHLNLCYNLIKGT